MARRRLLSDEQLAPLWAWASDERAIVRHYTLSRADLDLIAKKRTASNRLGFAVLMCGMRFPGRALESSGSAASDSKPSRPVRSIASRARP
jgi:TnpA family transposase